MKNKLKIVSYLIGILLAIIIALLSYVKFKLPNVGDAPNLKVELSTQNIERGKYLANHVMVCIDCHSTRDWSLYSGPIVKGTEGKGGESFDQRFGFPGKYISKNLTPYHLKNWTD
ncbi:MAG TPA: cytochrome C, partial [Chitinophagales bacterium]|nr:cytochrome C [Chitinophagales bacterium]